MRLISMKKNILHQKFSLLTVIKFIGYVPISTPNKKRGRWLCSCICGNTTELYTGELISGKIKSCGCHGKHKLNGDIKCSLCNKFLAPSNFSGTNSACNSCSKEQRKGYYNKDIINRRAKQRALYQIHKEKRKLYAKKYRIKNLDKLQKSSKLWKAKNPNYKREKLKSDINFRIKENLRGRLYKAIKNNSKAKSTLKLLGCTIDELKAHITSLFLKGMTWDNYGKWHIDHIKPCSLFDFSKGEEQLKCFHYTNLQPLWAIDNLIKNNKYEEC